ncbi:hypothetical protein OsJ_35553 [Oryza sativa Japonica Group]|nr:hypothetical protein OsJ_35553 [Oryza sativa Japonica Group]
MASMKLVADDGATSTTKIPTTDYSKETHAKCSMLGFDVKWDANKADITFLTKTVVLETVPASIASLSAFSPRMIADIKQYTLMPTRYILWSNKLKFNVGVKSELSFLINLIAATSKEGIYIAGEPEYLLLGLSFVEMERKDNCYLSWRHLLLARVMVVELSSTGQFGSENISIKGKHVDKL